ncbi:MAG TPA: ribosome-associated translation inhibitor RaiA [Bacteroidia bacterium]|nr:ribosome-associated translation inhibitor RaiA [Bacteroidia bacterium]
MKIDIHAKNVELNDSLRQLINNKVSKLNTFHNQIINTDVYLRNEGESLHSNEIQIKLSVRNQTLVAKETNESFEKALDLAVNSMKRQLKKIKEK